LIPLSDIVAGVVVGWERGIHPHGVLRFRRHRGEDTEFGKLQRLHKDKFIRDVSSSKDMMISSKVGLSVCHSGGE
jgi:hypothetical protein